MTSLDQIVADPSLAATLTPDAKRRLMLQIAAALSAMGAVPLEPPPADRCLTVIEACRRLGISKSKFYQVGASYPFARRDPNGQWVISEQGVDAWIAGKR